jgi:hypothetical protein
VHVVPQQIGEISMTEEKPKRVLPTTDIDYVAQAIAVLKYVAAQQVKLDDMKERAEATIKAALGDQFEEGHVDGKPVVRWTKSNTHFLNQKRLREERPDIHAEFYDSREQRTFKLVPDDGS